MDYIVFGIGTGSSLLLIGWLLRDGGPALRDRRSRSATEVLGAKQLVDQMRWARFCAACGVALAMGGALLLLVTVIALLVGPTDIGGVWTVLVTFGVVSVGMLTWSWLFISRFGTAGIIRARPGPPQVVVAPEAHDLLNDHDEHDDLEAPERAAAPAAGQSSPSTTFAAPNAESHSSPDEVQRERIEVSESEEAVAVKADDDGDAPGEASNDEVPADGDDDEPISTLETSVPAGVADLPDQAGTIDVPPTTEEQSGEDQPVSADVSLSEITVQIAVQPAAKPVVPAPDRRDDSSSVDPADGERAGEPAPMTHADEPDDREEVEEDVVDAPERAVGRVEALRRLRQRRLG